MKSLSKLLLLTAFLYPSQSWAEGPCPAGQRMVGQQNVPGAAYPICQPIPGNNSAPPQPRAVWADRWGAITSDSAKGKAGVAIGRSSRAEAIDAATQDCAANGGETCQLELAFRNQCAAGAWGPGKGGMLSWTSDPHREGAEKRATARCEETSGNTCQIFYSDCSYAEKIQ